jgi:viologen exporter family transport system permease protein
MGLRYYLGLYRDYFRMALKVLVQYRTDFVLTIGTTMLREGCILLFLAAIFGKIAQLQGWSFYEVVLIYGLSTVVGNLSPVFLNMPHALGWYVMRGQLDVLLVRPPRPLFQLLGEQCFTPTAAGSVVTGIGIVGVALARVDEPFQGWWVPYLVLVTISGVLAMFSIYLMVACLTFWFTSSGSLMILLGYLPEYARYPLSMYASPIRFTMTWVLPYAMAAVLPVGFLLGKDGYGVYGVIAPLMGWIFLGLGLAFWSVAVRQYKSTGT